MTREEAIAYGEDYYRDLIAAVCDIGEKHKAFVKMSIEALKERKTGKWEIYVISMLDGEGCKCSECGFEGAPYWHFCPNCGAKMEVEI